MKRILALLAVVILLAACSPSENAVQTAIALTEEAKPTETPLPTNTPNPTATNTPIPTATATPRPTKTAVPKIESYDDYALAVSDEIERMLKDEKISGEVIVKTDNLDAKEYFMVILKDISESDESDAVAYTVLALKYAAENITTIKDPSPDNLLISFVNGENVEHYSAKWRTVKAYIEGDTDHSPLLFELVLNRYIK